jgi:hypothetical protein
VFKLLRALIDRLKLLLATAAARELEADLLADGAACQVELLRQAQRYHAEGLHAVAAVLRRRAEDLDPQRPLARALPAAEQLAVELTAAPPSGPAGNGTGEAPALPGPATRPDRSGRKR